MKIRTATILCKTANGMRNLNLLLCGIAAIVLLVMVLCTASIDTFTNALLITVPVWLLQVIYETAYRVFKTILLVIKG